MKEIWKDIPGYEGLYQVSNLGNVKSLPRKICNYQGFHISKERILKPGKNSKGYLSVVLSDNKNNIIKSKKVHQLVAMAFLNHKPDGSLKKVIDHINNNKSDNKLHNLQIITNRENCSKDVKNKTSKYTGVSWEKRRKKWVVRIKINKKYLHLGYFDNEIEAHICYQNKLKDILTIC